MQRLFIILAALLCISTPWVVLAAPSLHVSLVDRLGPQGNGPAFQTLDERRRGPLFAAALHEVSQSGRLPLVQIVNRDLSLPLPVPDETKLPAGTTLLRIYLTEWSETPVGGPADAEIFCRFFVEGLRDGRVEYKQGPFFARRRYNVALVTTAQERWDQFQAAARQAIEQMATAVLPERKRRQP